MVEGQGKEATVEFQTCLECSHTKLLIIRNNKKRTLIVTQWKFINQLTPPFGSASADP